MVDLGTYNNNWYYPGANPFKRLIWYLINEIIFKTGLYPFSTLKVFILRLFGAKIGRGVVIKPCVNIKYPWFLSIGDNTWIGEDVWIDSLTTVSIGANCCLSQGAMILTGNHNYKLSSFNLIVKPVYLEDGVWIGAKSIVCPGVVCLEGSVLFVNSVATENLKPNSINRGNPSVFVKTRV